MTKEEQQYGKLQWFFMIILIPTVFAMILFSVILSFMGVSVIDEAKHVASRVPVLSNYIKTDEQLEEEDRQVKIEELTDTLSQREREIELLINDLEGKETEIKALQEELENLAREIELLQASEVKAITDFEDLAKVYASMNPQSAARIIDELTIETAAIQLSFVETNARAAILATMEPERAARIIELTKENLR